MHTGTLRATPQKTQKDSGRMQAERTFHDLRPEVFKSGSVVRVGPERYVLVPKFGARVLRGDHIRAYAAPAVLKVDALDVRVCLFSDNNARSFDRNLGERNAT